MSVKLHKTVLKRITDKILVKITRHREFRRQWIWNTFTPTQLLFITSLSIPVLWHYYIRVPESYRHIEVWANLPLLNPRTPDRTFPERWKDRELGLEIETQDTHTFIHKIITANLLVEPVDFYAPLSPETSRIPPIAVVESVSLPTETSLEEEVISEEEVEENREVEANSTAENEAPNSRYPDLDTLKAASEASRRKESGRLRSKLTKKTRKRREEEAQVRKQSQAAAVLPELSEAQKTYQVFNQVQHRRAHQAALKKTLKQAFDTLKDRTVVTPGLHATFEDRELLVKTSQEKTSISKDLVLVANTPTLEELASVAKEWQGTQKERLRRAQKAYRKSLLQHLVDYFKSWAHFEEELRTNPEFFVDLETGLVKIGDSRKLREEGPAVALPPLLDHEKWVLEKRDTTRNKYDLFETARQEKIAGSPAIPEAAKKSPLVEQQAKSIQARAVEVQHRLEHLAVVQYRRKLTNLQKGKQAGQFLRNFYLPLVTQEVYLDWKDIVENPRANWRQTFVIETKRIREKFNYHLLRWSYRDEILLEHVKTLEDLLNSTGVHTKSPRSLVRQPFQFFYDLSISPAKWDARILEEVTARTLAHTALRKEWAIKKKQLENRIFAKSQRAKQLPIARQAITNFVQSNESYYTEFVSYLFQTKEGQEADKQVQQKFLTTLEKLQEAWNRQRRHVRQSVEQREGLWESQPDLYQTLKNEFVNTVNQLERKWEQELRNAAAVDQQITQEKYEKRYTLGTKLSQWFWETRASLYETLGNFFSLSLQIFSTAKQNAGTIWWDLRDNTAQAREIEIAGYFYLAERWKAAKEEFYDSWLDTLRFKDFIEGVCVVHNLVADEARKHSTYRTIVQWDPKNSKRSTYITGDTGTEQFWDDRLPDSFNLDVNDLAKRNVNTLQAQEFASFTKRDWEKWVSLSAKNRLRLDDYEKAKNLARKAKNVRWEPKQENSLWKLQSKVLVAYGKFWVKLLNWYYQEELWTYGIENARKQRVAERWKDSSKALVIGFALKRWKVPLVPVARTQDEIDRAIEAVQYAEESPGTVVNPDEFLEPGNRRRTKVNTRITQYNRIAPRVGKFLFRVGLASLVDNAKVTGYSLRDTLLGDRKFNTPLWLANKTVWETDTQDWRRGLIGKLVFERSCRREAVTKQLVAKAITTLQNLRSPFNLKVWEAEERQRYEQARRQIWEDFFQAEKVGPQNRKAEQKRNEERVARLKACEKEHEEWRNTLREGAPAYLKKKVEAKQFFTALDPVFSHLESWFTKLEDFLNGNSSVGRPPRAHIIPRGWNLSDTSFLRETTNNLLSDSSSNSLSTKGLHFTTLSRNDETTEDSQPTPNAERPESEIREAGTLIRPKTQFRRAAYHKVEVGESPARWERREVKLTTRWDEETDEPTAEVRPGPSLYYPTPARRTVDIVEGIQGRRFTLRTEGRWRETYAALANQVFQERDLIWEPIRPWAKVEPETVPNIPAIALPEIPIPTETASSPPNWGDQDSDSEDTGVATTRVEEQDLEIWATRAKELYDQPLISLPYQYLESIPEPGRKSSPIRSERFVGPLKGLRTVPTGLHSVRVLVDIKNAARDLDLQDYPLLWDEENQPDRGHEYYDNVTDTLEEDALERDAEGFYEKIRTLRFRPWRLLSDRPYRAIRLANRALGERSRPRRAAAERPFRRRDPVSRGVQSVVNNSLGGLPENYEEGSVNTVLLPSKPQAAERLLPEKKRVQPWAHYRLGNDLSIAQARRRWWREWHNYDPELFDDQRRAGTLTNERIGRQNLGWWRSLLPTELHAPFETSGEGVPGEEREFERRVNYSIDPKAEERAGERQQWHWSQHRYVTLGWLSRLKDLGPVRNDENLDLDFEIGENEEEEEFKFSAYRGLATWKWERLPYTPWTVIFVYWAYRYRKYGYDRFYDDFLKVRAKFLFEGGGVRELDPQWTHWLLEVLGINRSGAAIQIFKPGKRKFKKQLAGLRRELPLLEEWFVHLRYCRRVWSLPKYNPRPSLLVGLPGTGKTSVIRTLADECEVPVIYQCVSSFTDAPPRFTQFGYGKTTAPRAVSRGFEAARNAAPAIFFLDEIDRRGKNRGAVLEDPHPEQSTRVLTPASDDQILGLSQLLVEVDSTRKNKGLILVAATNRPEELDPALVRAGRFDRTIVVDLPNRAKRRAILKFYAGRLGRSPALDWEYVVARTIGYTPARLASLTNTAAIFAITAGINEHTQECFDLAIERLHSPDTTLRGQNWKNPYIRLREAYYQAARGLISWVLYGKDGLQWLRLGELPPHVPRDGFYRRSDRRHQIQVLRGGRAGERFLVNEVFGTEALDSSRSKPEILQARRIARRRNYERSFDLGYWRGFPKLSVAQDAEFYRDPKLGEYRREKIIKEKKSKAIKSKHLKEKIDPFRTEEQLKEYDQPPVQELRKSEVFERLARNEYWYKEWTRFEIQEYWNLRWPLWLPPERHRRPKRVRPHITLFVTVQQRKLLYEALQRNLWILTDYRAELDVVAAQLLIGSSVTQKKVRELLPDLREKVQKRWEKEQGLDFIIETESTDLVEEGNEPVQPLTAIATEPTKIPEDDIVEEGTSQEAEKETSEEKPAETKTEPEEERPDQDVDSDDEFDETRGDLQK
jgi:SpoVK/Ycf46/Vps4 family AAA+-type ATPase